MANETPLRFERLTTHTFNQIRLHFLFEGKPVTQTLQIAGRPCFVTRTKIGARDAAILVVDEPTRMSYIEDLGAMGWFECQKQFSKEFLERPHF